MTYFRIYDKLINVCEDLYKTKGASQATTLLYHSDHSSTVIQTLRKLIIETQGQNTTEGMRRLLPIYLNLLKICLRNVFNTKKALVHSIDQLLLNILACNSVSTSSKIYHITKRSENLAKLGLALMVQKDSTLISKLMEKPYFVSWLAKTDKNGLFEEGGDLKARSQPVFEMYEASFKSTGQTEALLAENPLLITDIIKLTRKSYGSGENEVLISNLRAFKQFSRLTSLLEYITPPEMIEILIDLSLDCPLTS